jgi:hypothetical protein
MRLLPTSFLAVLLVIAWPATAADPEPPSTPKLPPTIEAPLNGIRAMITNAEARFNNGIVDMGLRQQDAPFPGRACCSSNLTKIAERAQELDAALTALSACYDAEQVPAMVAGAEFARGDLRNLGTALTSFANARQRSQAQGALGAVTRAYLQLRTSSEALTACGDKRKTKKRAKAGSGS